MDPPTLLSALANASSDRERLVLAKRLSAAVTAQYRSLSPQAFTTRSNELSKQVSNLFASASSGHKLAGIMAVHAVAEANIQGTSHIFVRFSNLLRSVFDRTSNTDVKILRVASKALGELCRGAGDVAPDFIQFEVTRALEWLRPQDRGEHRLAAVLVCREVADNAPTLFFQYAEQFFAVIPTALQDPTVLVRECATKALRSVLDIVKNRRGQERSEWYTQLFSNVKALTVRTTKPHAVHGGLLAMGDMLARTGTALRPHYRSMCDTVMGYRDSKDPLVRRTVMALIPHLAHFSPQQFVAGHADEALDFLLSTLRSGHDRGIAYVAVGQLSLALKGVYPEHKMRPQLDRIVACIKDGLTPKRGHPFCGQGLTCLRMLAAAVGPALTLHVHDLLGSMFADGLSVVLVDALRGVVSHLPTLLELVQERLLHELSLILAGRPWAPPPSDAVAIPPTTGAAGALRTSQAKAMGLLGGASAGTAGGKAAALGGMGGRGAEVATGRFGLGGDASVAGYAAAAGSERGTAGALAGESAAGAPLSWARSMLSGTATAGGGTKREGGASGVSYAGAHEDEENPADTKVVLALRTLVSFDFRGVQLLPFVRESVMPYADDVSPAVREEALWTAARILLRPYGEGVHPLGPGPAFEGVIPTPAQLRSQLEAAAPHATAVSMVPSPWSPTPAGGYRSASGSPGHRYTAQGAAGGSSGGVGIVPGVDTYVPVLLVSSGVTLVVVQEILFRIVMAAVGDPLPAVRLAAWRCLDARFDPLLAQAGTLVALGASLRDECFEVRQHAVSVIGRALPRNPAYVLPLMRSLLLELLSELEFGVRHGSGSHLGPQGGEVVAQNMASQEHAALLLGQLITAAQPVVGPYVPPILRALLPKLAVGGRGPALRTAFTLSLPVTMPASSALTMNVLGTLGELCKVGAGAMAPYLQPLLQLTLSTLQDTSDAGKLQIAVRTLGLLVQNTGAVMLPYVQFPSLLPALLNIVRSKKNKPWTLHREALRTVGILGALDPHRYHLTQTWAAATSSPDSSSHAGEEGSAGNNGVSSATAAAAAAADEAAVHPLQAAAGGLRPPVVTFDATEDSDALDAGLTVLKSATDAYSGDDGDRDDPHMTGDGLAPGPGGALGNQGPLAPAPDAGPDDEQSVLYTDIPASRILTSMVAEAEDFYPTVALSALLRILQDPAESNNHGQVLQAVTWVFRALGHRCVPFLPRVVPTFLRILRSRGRMAWPTGSSEQASSGPGGDSSLRDSLLQQLGVLVGLVKARMCPYLPLIFELIDEAWPASLPSILRLIEEVANALPDEFQTYLPVLLRHMLATLHSPTDPGASSTSGLSRGRGASMSPAPAAGGDAAAGITNTRFLLATIAKLGSQLSGHMGQLLPAICALVEHPAIGDAARVQAMLTLAHLCASGVDMRPYVARVVQPLCRVLGDNSGLPAGAKKCAADTLCWLLCQMGGGFVLFVPTVARALAVSGLEHALLQQLLESVVVGGALPPSPVGLLAQGREEAIEGVAGYLGHMHATELHNMGEGGGALGAAGSSSALHVLASSGVYGQAEVHAAKLAAAWATTGCHTKEDWQEWMRRFSLELLRESSSPALRSCCSLAQVYRPLSLHLFNAAFVSCYEHLDVTYQGPLVENMERALLHPELPTDILQMLLNLAEFMEHRDKPLPIDIRTLGELALRCHAYAKALRYREMEFYRQVQDLGSSEWEELHVSAGGGKTRGASTSSRRGEKTASKATTGTAKVIETLISINNQLEQPEAAIGILKFAQAQAYSATALHNTAVTAGTASVQRSAALKEGGASLGMLEVKETWFEKLGRWEDALDAYDRRWDSVAGELMGQHATVAEVGASHPHKVQQHLPLHVGRMRCLKALGEWDRLHQLVRQVWPQLRGDGDKALVAPYAARACWALGHWHDMEKFLAYTHDERLQGSFFRAVLAIHRGLYSTAERFLDRTRSVVALDLPALVSESYTRAYRHLVTVQQLSEMEEVISILRSAGGDDSSSRADAAATAGRLTHIRRVWAHRLRGTQRNVDIWHRILSVRSLVGMAYMGAEDRGSWVKFASLCRRNGRNHMASKVLMGLGMDGAGGLAAARPGSYFSALEAATRSTFSTGGLVPNSAHLSQMLAQGGANAMLGGGFGSAGGPLLTTAGEGRGATALPPHPAVLYAFCKHLWDGRQHRTAIQTLGALVSELDASAAARADSEHGRHGAYRYGHGAQLTAHEERVLLVKTHLRLGSWQLQQLETTGQPVPLQESPHHHSAVPSSSAGETSGERFVDLMRPVLAHFHAATASGESHYRAWHEWALGNFQAAQRLHAVEAELREEGAGAERLGQVRAALDAYAVAAVSGFFSSIRLGRQRLKAHVLQDLLRLLTLWFTHGGGGHPTVRAAVAAGLTSIPTDTWLQVIPQLIARIHLSDADIKGLLMSLLAQAGQKHPHAVIYSLTVATNSMFAPRREAAETLLGDLRRHWAAIAEQATLVSQQLIRVAILWPEQWHSGLEEASGLYFSEKNTEGCITVLLELHAMMDKPPHEQSAHEAAFTASYGAELEKARQWLYQYHSTKQRSAVQAAWDIYYAVFRRIDDELPRMTSLELQMVSPPLVSEQNLRLAVPGTYRVHAPIVRISWFSPTVAIFPSKQRPRRIAIAGTDGRWYRFLLKGHEDLRQDERVMQLFGLVNTLLSNDADTRKQDLGIRRYSVTPLSQAAGVVGWLAGHDTWHSLIEEYRSSKKIAVNVEQRVMARQAPHYENLRLLAKAEVFTYALDNTTGLDLARVLWRKSTSSERWLQRRTQYTRSLAVMSMVGYVLGLGDRHPSNLMLDRASGRIAHIDFGDCFEVAMTRDKLPERVPFRLTRMLINSMEVSGIEGNFRCTAEGVMRVLRRNRDSVMAMLEAFVHDPLINWRLLHTSDASGASVVEDGSSAADALGGVGPGGSAAAEPVGAASIAANPAARGGARGGADKPQGEGDGGATEGLNERAVLVLERIKNKLTGRDFIQDPVNSGIGGPVAGQCTFQRLPAVGETCESVADVENGERLGGRAGPRRGTNTMSLGEDLGENLDVAGQVQRLVLQATSHENLCQSYIGWCPFW